MCFMCTTLASALVHVLVNFIFQSRLLLPYLAIFLMLRQSSLSYSIQAILDGTRRAQMDDVKSNEARGEILVE